MCGRYTERENGEIRHRITTATFADHTEHLLELSNCTAPTVSAKTARFPISCPLAAFGGGGKVLQAVARLWIFHNNNSIKATGKNGVLWH